MSQSETRISQEFICQTCAERLGGRLDPDRISTWLYAICPRCKTSKPLTEPRDFGLHSGKRLW